MKPSYLLLLVTVLIMFIGFHLHVDYPSPTTTVNHVSLNGVIYVDHRVLYSYQDGSSWETAYSSLQDALMAANSGDEIWVAKGVYYPDIGSSHRIGDRKATFTLKEDVALYGGFSGTERTLTERDWRTNLTILSGDVDRNDEVESSGILLEAGRIKGGNSNAVVTARGVSRTAGMCQEL